MDHNDSGLTGISIEPRTGNSRSDPHWDAFLTKAGISPLQLNAIDFDVKPPGRGG